jgi:hypothetical protein
VNLVTGAAEIQEMTAEQRSSQDVDPILGACRAGRILQPTTQPTKCDVLYDFRELWQSPRFCYVVEKLIHAALSRQRSRVRVSSSPPFIPKELGEIH